VIGDLHPDIVCLYWR